MAANYIVNVVKLKGRENYSDWAFAVENFLILEGLWKCVTEVVADDDAKAKAKIILIIDASLYIHIKEAKTTVELWTKLKSLFDDSGFTRKISLLRNLISTRLENSDPMAGYVNQIVETGQTLRGTGFKIDDEWIGSLLIAGLSEKFSPMIMAIEHSEIAITTDSIKTKLLDMESDVGHTGRAFATKGFYSSNGSKQKDGSIGKVKKDLKDVKCYKCKQKRHFKNKCPNPENDSKSRSSNAFSAVFLNGSFNKDDWYVDSGASVHLTANKNLLENLVQTSTKEIMVANEMKVPVTCSGDVNLQTIVGKDSFDNNEKCVVCS
ncbi:hypothetical protein JTB14_015182 [Gonioctena quinquepunctata]|nr:hypothetical protein JTB14_015182 [Gonioctena quinquepunctata]